VIFIPFVRLHISSDVIDEPIEVNFSGSISLGLHMVLVQKSDLGKHLPKTKTIEYV